MTTTEKLTLKTLAELEREINSGKTAYTAGVNHGSAGFQLLDDGQYFCELQTIAGGLSFESDERAHQTMQQFIDSIEWDDSNALHVELRSCLSQPVWYVEPDSYMVDPNAFDDTGVYQGKLYPIPSDDPFEF